jgi:hypothetical protein
MVVTSNLEKAAMSWTPDVNFRAEGEVEIHEGAIVAERIANRQCRHIKGATRGAQKKRRTVRYLQFARLKMPL